MSTTAEPGHKHRGYRASKASDVEWLGDVPQHWDVLRLKYSAELVNEKVNGAECELPYTGLEHIESWTGKRLSTDAGRSTDGQASLHRAGDVLFGKLRPYLAKAYAAEGDGVCTSELLVLRPKAVLPRFLRDYLLSQGLISVVDSSTYGAKMPRASWDFIGGLPVLVPPLDEQRSIVAFLNRETARIDGLIEKKRRQIELLHEKRAALISHTVTKGLDPTAPMKDSGIDWIGPIPSHWTVARVKHVARLESGHTPSRSIPEHWLDSNDIPWVSLNDTKWLAENDWISDTTYNINALGLQNSSARLLPARVVVFTRDATIGKAAITTRPMAVSQHLIAWVCGPKLLPEYLLRVFYAMEPALERYTFGATIKTIGMDDVRTLVTPLPPLDDQLRIVHWIGPRLERIAAVVRKIEVSIDRLREYRTTLISAAVTGKIDARREVA